MEELVWVATMVAALYGIADLIERLAFRIIYGNGNRHYLVLFSRKGCEDTEYAVRRLAAARRFFPLGYHTTTLLLTTGKPDDSLIGLCERLHIKPCTEKEFNEMLTDGLQGEKKQV